MLILNGFISKIAAILVAIGCPVANATLCALILLYLLTTGILALFLVWMIVRRRNRKQEGLASLPDRES